MKQEFGKWFLDVAKYILTALILTYFFGEMGNTLALCLSSGLFLICLFIGFFLLRQGEKEHGTDVRSMRNGCSSSDSRPVGRKRRRKTKPETTKPAEIENNE
jgi:hypothetical protein